MAGVRSFVALMLMLSLPAAASAGASARSVIELTDATFDQQVAKGALFIKVYADWCTHCKQMAPVWEQLALELLDDEIAVGNVNGPNQKALFSRLQVKEYPTLLLLRDGKTYEYSGQHARTLAKLAAFAREGYKTAKAWPFHKAPNSIVGRLFGQATNLPLVLENTYKDLRETHSDTTIIAAVICMPVLFGLACICFIDVLSTRRPAPRPHAA